MSPAWTPSAAPRNAETQTLIAKLEGGLGDRVEALLETRPDYNQVHLNLAAVYNSTTANKITTSTTLQSVTRAQVIAWLDYVKAEMPDTFYVQTGFDPMYPLNFAGNAFPTTSTAFTCSPYVLPLGQADGWNTLLAPLGDRRLWRTPTRPPQGSTRISAYLPAG